MTYFQVFALIDGEMTRHTLQYQHQLAGFFELHKMSKCDVCVVECVDGIYHRALLQELKEYEVKEG